MEVAWRFGTHEQCGPESHRQALHAYLLLHHVLDEDEGLVTLGLEGAVRPVYPEVWDAAQLVLLGDR